MTSHNLYFCCKLVYDSNAYLNGVKVLSIVTVTVLGLFRHRPYLVLSISPTPKSIDFLFQLENYILYLINKMTFFDDILLFFSRHFILSPTEDILLWFIIL